MIERSVAILISFLLGFGVIVLPAMIFVANPVLAVAVAAMMALFTAIALPDRLLGVVLIATIFQNLVLNIISPFVEFEALGLAKAFSFVVTMVAWAVVMVTYVLDRRPYSGAVHRWVFESFLVLTVVGVFTALGLVFAGGNAIVYARSITTPIVLFQIAILTSNRWRLDYGSLLAGLALVLLPIGYLELIDRDLYLAITNGDHFWRETLKPLKESGMLEGTLDEGGGEFRHLTDYFRVVLFNSSLLADLDLYVLRLYGPNGHPISYGYLLAFLVIVLGSMQRWVLVAAILPLLIFVSAKGAVIEIALVATAFVLWGLLKPRFALMSFAGLLGTYIVVTFVTGLRIGDYHVIGLVGGLKGFLANPIGRGVGVGGNIGNELTSAEWAMAQAKGSTDVALESAIGVLLYQMGVMAFAVIVFYARVALRALALYAKTGIAQYLVAGAGVLIVLTNGIFQEEALFAPLAMGVMLSFAGVAIGSAERGRMADPIQRRVERQERPQTRGSTALMYR